MTGAHRPVCLRPAVHWIGLLDSYRGQDLRRPVQALVDCFTENLSPADAARLQAELDRWDGQPKERLARTPIVRSPRLFSGPDDARRRQALFVYQDGRGIIVHLIHYWEGAAERTTLEDLFARVASGCRTVGQADWLGQGLLFTGVLPPQDAPTLPSWQEQATKLAASWLAPFLAHGAHWQPRPLEDGLLILAEDEPLDLSFWPAAIIWSSEDAEASPRADRIATVTWPLLVQYRMRLEADYGSYRRTGAPALAQAVAETRATLSSLAAEAGDGLLAAHTPDRLQADLAQLTPVQFRMLDQVGRAEEYAHGLQRELANLQQTAAELPLDPVEARLRGFVAQVRTDVEEAAQAGIRISRAIDVVRTQADVMESRYERQLNWLIGVIGTALAIGQVLDQGTALVVYAWFFAVWSSLGLPVGPPVETNLLVFVVRMAGIGLAGLLAAVLIHFLMKARRPPGLKR